MTLRRLVIALVLVAIVGLALGYRAATAEPLRRDLLVRVRGWPPRAPPVRLVLLSDLHVVEPEMPVARLRTLVARINAIDADCVLIAGDLLGDRRGATRLLSFDEAVAPLGDLRPRVATMAVLGNHDHWQDGPAASRALQGRGVQVLGNRAARCGAVTIGGVDDIDTGHANVAATEAAMRASGGVGVIVSHSPDVFPQVTRAGLTLAGHTHCGQVASRLLGPILVPSRYGRRYACGTIAEGGRTLVVTAGIGTSVIPLRWGAPPDFWVVTLVPAAPA